MTAIVIPLHAAWHEYAQAAKLVRAMADEALVSGDWQRTATLTEEAKAYDRGADVALRRALGASLEARSK